MQISPVLSGDVGAGNGLAVLAAQPHVVVGERPAERARLVARGAQVQHGQADLDDAERLRDRRAEARGELARGVRAQALGGRDRQAQVGEPERGRVLRQQAHVVGRRVEHGRALARGELEDRPRERARRQQDRRAAREVEQDRHHEVMRHRQQPQDAVGRADAEPAVRGVEAREDRGVAEDHALAPAGGAGGEAQIRGPERRELALARAVDRLRCRPREELEVGALAVGAFERDLVEARALGEALEHRARVVVGDRHEAGVGGEDRERELDEARALARDQAAALRRAARPRRAGARRAASTRATSSP